MYRVLMLLIFTLLIVPSVPAAEDLSAELRAAFEASRQAEGKKLDDYTLVDQDGMRFNLSEYFRSNKPLVISFIYTSCPTICPTITSEFKTAVDKAEAQFKGRFNVLTVGFDTVNDTPEKLKRYGSKFTKDFSNFRLASGDEETVKRLAAQTGFYFKKKDDGSFDHIDMATVVNPDGTIFKQAYSVRSQPENLLARIEEAVTGRPVAAGQASLIDKIKFFCYKYDPYTGRYVIDYPIILSVFMQALVIGAIIYFVWGKRIRERRRERRSSK